MSAQRKLHAQNREHPKYVLEMLWGLVTDPRNVTGPAVGWRNATDFVLFTSGPSLRGPQARCVKDCGMRSWRDARVYTVGHSTRSLDELVALLRAFEVAVLVDVRTIARSRHNPQFNADALPGALRMPASSRWSS